MAYAAALVSMFVLAGGIAVIAGTIGANLERVVDAFFGQSEPTVFRPVLARRAAVSQPRVVAVRPLLRAAA